MSWIKRLLQMFNGEEGEMKQSEPLRTNNNSGRQQRQFTEQNKIEPKKEVEARVLYKYPKGQFKFPLIPDAEIEKKAHPKNVRRTENRTKTVTPIHKERPAHKEKPIEKEPTPVKPVFQPKAPKPKPNMNRQPFRRTETPSPIFAFNRPKSDEIEYELKGFNTDVSDEEQTQRKEFVGAQEKTPTKEAEVAQEQTPIKEVEVAQEQALTKEVEVVQEQAPTKEVEVAQEEQAPTKEAEVAQEQAQIKEVEVAQEQAPTKEVEVAQEEQAPTKEAKVAQEQAQIKEVGAAQEQISIKEVEGPQETSNEEVEVVSEQAPIEAVRATQFEPPSEEVREEASIIKEDVTQVETPILLDEEARKATILTAEEAQGDVRGEAADYLQQATPIERNELVQEAEMSARNEVDRIKQEDQRRVFEKDNSLEYTETEPKQVQESLLEKPDSDEKIKKAIEDVPVAASLEAAPERKKRQLPFNVLMLKQDKRKLEEQKNLADTILQKFNPVKNSRAVSEKETATGNETEKDTETVINEETEAKALETAQPSNYEFPPLNLLQPPVMIETSREWLESQEMLLNETLKNFNVGARVVNVTQGPAVTRFEVQPEPGVKVNKITNLSDDIKLSLAARDIRIEAPIPGKHTIGIEVPNETSRPVLISEILRTSGFNENTSPLAVALGLDIAGSPVVTDLKKMPHGLIAGATGSGKSVCINTMLVSLLYKAHPDDVKLLLIDPKMVELAPYNQIPHLVSPVITDVKAATASLKWAVEEMERRYELFAHTGVRDISRFNELALEHKRYSEKLPYIVIVIDELADLMMMSPADVEEAICRIAQKARACGIHLVIATQRPSVDVITGLIKANVPTRVAFSVSSQVDSRTIIDISGAEKLLGRGDMLFLENGKSKPFRLQGTFVSDQEIDDIVAFVRKQRDPEYLFEQDELIKKSQITEDEDELFYEACLYVIEQDGASTSSIQRRFKIGYNRAARLIDMMEQNGFISEGRGSKPRDVLISIEDLDSFQENHSLT
ncbi:DNA translocase FtsK [Mesobacillus maritimus]|uniref:DNA translocase FtsK n=1 Tax=Mesobacillus maritimus TaxID=1643336 RepID=A0ABS7K9R3_9BACI|nr:DNA translocase FtsK [Mesobacillus maritimus]MBY0098963.1 DNA translocase FtsK [Mesobacillus maritimus]